MFRLAVCSPWQASQQASSARSVNRPGAVAGFAFDAHVFADENAALGQFVAQGLEPGCGFHGVPVGSGEGQVEGDFAGLPAFVFLGLGVGIVVYRWVVHRARGNQNRAADVDIEGSPWCWGAAIGRSGIDR